MIGPVPDFFMSEYFEKKPEWHLKEGASESDKKELEEYMNDGAMKKRWKKMKPEMKKPYYTWYGEIVDKG